MNWASALVVSPPVGLDDEAMLGPVKVGLVGAQRTVGVGRGEVVLLAQGEEIALEDAAQHRLLRVLRDRFGQLRGAVAVRVSIEDSLDLVEIQDAELLRAIDGGDEDAVWHHLRNVEEGAGEAGEGGVKCVDALMNPVQAPASCSLRDRVTAQAQAQAQCLELPAAGHPFMACHEPGNRGLGGSRGAFSAHMAHKAPSAYGSLPSRPFLARRRS